MRALETSEELEELQRIERQLEKLQDKVLSYADQQAEGLISKAIHKELLLRSRESRRELMHARA